MIDNTFRIAPSWGQAPLAGERDVADIRMEAGQQVLSRVLEVETGEVRDSFRASAVSLALWFTDNWWRLRWEPLGGRYPSPDWRLAHEISSAGSGFNWPPMMMYGTGARVVFGPAFGGRLTTGPIRYLGMDHVHVVAGQHFETTLDTFIKTTIHGCANAVDGAALMALYRQLQDERADPGVAEWRALEARLGFDPDDAPDGLIEGLAAKQDALGREAVEEAAVAAAGPGAATALSAAVEAAQASDLSVSLDIAGAIDLSKYDQRHPLWRWGEDAAREVRGLLGIGNQPFSGTAFAELLQEPWEKIRTAEATALHLPYAALMREGSASAKLALAMRPVIYRRFELARMIGDAIWMGSEAFGVISRSKTDRQKFQRGFAQALLCPFQEVLRYIDAEDPTDEQIVRAARRFEVHESVVRTLLVNKNVLPRETLLDQLEAA